MDHGAEPTDLRRVAMGVVTFLGLYQGAVPLLVRGLLGRDQRFAPAMWLSAPWWWIACLAIVAVAVTLLAVLDTTSEGEAPGALATGPAPEDADTGGDGTGGYDALSGLVFLVGIYNGVAPFVARLAFDGDLLLALPLHLPAPWWWITSLAVIAATVALLAVIDTVKQRHLSDA